MAKFDSGDFDGLDEQLKKLSGNDLRNTVKRVVMAGAEADIGDLQKATAAAGHVRTGQMSESIKPGQYRESMGGGSVDVYPQGNDSKGASNTLKAFVINYGRGGRKTARTGDKFITGREKTTEEVVNKAMADEADAALRDLGLL